MKAVISPLADRAQCQGKGSEYILFDEISKRDENFYNHRSLDEHVFDIMPMKKPMSESKLPEWESRFEINDAHFEISEVRATKPKPVSSTLFDMEPIWDTNDDEVEVSVECPPIWDECEVIDDLIPQLENNLTEKGDQRNAEEKHSGKGPCSGKIRYASICRHLTKWALEI